MDINRANRPASFALHIRPLFTSDQRDCMQGYLDLWSHDDVAANVELVHAKLLDHSMPADDTGPWPDEWISLFSRWMSEGCAP